jgi:hypothetical protein
MLEFVAANAWIQRTPRAMGCCLGAALCDRAGPGWQLDKFFCFIVTYAQDERSC